MTARLHPDGFSSAGGAAVSGAVSGAGNNEYACGQVLLIKVLVIGVAVSMAVLHRRRLEFGVLPAALAAAALLAALPPPR